MGKSDNNPGVLPASHWGKKTTQEPEDEQSDTSSFRSSFLSSTTSVASSLRHYRSLHGRTYHSEIGNAQSWTPNDEKHVEVQDLVHASCLLAMDGKLHLSPLDSAKIQKVLDVGTGAGHWAIDFGDVHPNVEVIGTDITPIQPSWVPPNVSFQIDDANLEWTFPDNTFDFIYVRFLLGCIVDWNAFYKQAFRCTKPGGWFEQTEVQLKYISDVKPIPPDSPLGRLEAIFAEAGQKSGRSFTLYQDDLQRKGMESAGFTDIQVRNIKVPFGNWPKDELQKELGIITKAAFMEDLDGWMLYTLNNILNWKPEESQVFLAHVRKQLHDPELNLYFLRRVVYGRKPETN